MSARRFLARLETLGSLQLRESRVTDRIYYDTFDWRLYGRSMWLESEHSEEGSRLYLRRLAGGGVLRRLKALPKTFARDLPRGPFRQFLAEITEPRALLPRAVVRTVSKDFVLHDSEGRAVAGIQLEEHRAGASERPPSTLLQRRLTVRQERGEAARTRELLAFLRISLALQPPQRTLWEEATAASGSVPGDYSSKIVLELEGSMPARKALASFLQGLHGTMDRNLEGTLSGTDPEFLHDFRVSVRRTRAALTQLGEVLDEGTRDRFRREFAWLQEVTGPSRDMDVYLLAFPAYRQGLPPEMRRDVNPLKTYLEAHHGESREAMRKDLLSSRYGRLAEEWKAHLERLSSGEGGEFGAGAERPVSRVAAERIWRNYRRILKEGRAIDDDAPPENLHELRKTCKKLRYLLEFFRSLYPRKKVDRLISALKGLQDNLGDFQDFQVQSEALELFSRRMEQEGKAPPRTYMAMGRIVEGLHWRSLEARREFRKRFRGFTRRANRDLFRKLFRPKGDESKGEDVEKVSEDGQGDRAQVPRPE